MKSKKIFPYPIIGEDTNDFPSYSFSGTVVSFSQDTEFYNFEIKFSLDEPFLISLIEKEDVVFIVTLNNDSIYRESFKHSNIDELLKISIPINFIRGKFVIDFNFKICCNKAFNYENPNADKIFDGFSFNMEAGQLLGISEVTEKIILEQGFANFHNSNSFLKIRKGLEGATSTVIKPDTEIVDVYLTPENYDLYQSALNQWRSKSLLAVIVLPVIVELVHKIKSNTEEFIDEKYPWVGVLKEKFGEDPSFDDEESCYVVAEKILSNPTYAALMELNVALEMNNNQD